MNDMHYHDDPHKMNPFWNDNPQFRIHKQPGFGGGFGAFAVRYTLN